MEGQEKITVLKRQMGFSYSEKVKQNKMEKWGVLVMLWLEFQRGTAEELWGGIQKIKSDEGICKQYGVPVRRCDLECKEESKDDEVGPCGL